MVKTGLYTVGFGKAKITPPENMPMAGYIDRESYSSGVLDDLYARAAYIESSNGGRLLIVSLDIIRVDDRLYDEIASTLSRNHGLAREEINVVATHTHSGPEVSTSIWNTRPLTPGEKELVEKYRRYLVERVNEAVSEALRSKGLSDIFIGSTYISGVISNRITPSEPVDEEAVVVVVRDVSGVNRGVILNFACHPTVLGSRNTFISGDLAGKTCELIERETGGICVYLNGAAGNVSTRFTRKTQDYSEVIGFAGKIASKVMDVVNDNGLRKLKPTPIRTLIHNIELRIKNPPRIEDLYRLRQELEEKLKRSVEEKNYPLIKKIKSDLAGIVVALERRNFILENRCLRVNISLSWFGKELAIIFFPGEAFIEYQLLAKRSSPTKYTMFVGYANGYIGYIPYVRIPGSTATYEETVSIVDPGEYGKLRRFITRILKNIDIESVIVS